MIEVLRRTAAQTGRPRIEKIMSDIPDYHTTPVEAAEAANEPGVGLLVLYHLTPPPPNPILGWIFLRGIDDVRPEDWLMADDGTLVELPLGSDSIEVHSID